MSKDKKKKLQGFDKAVLKRVLTHIKKYRILVILSFVCAMITVASTLYAPILTGDAIDLIVGKGLVDFDGIKDIIYTFLMVTVVTVISQWFMNIINNHITYSVVRDIRIEVFNHMEELPLSYIDSHKHGDIVSRIVSDIDQFADGLLMGFTQLFMGNIHQYSRRTQHLERYPYPDIDQHNHDMRPSRFCQKRNIRKSFSHKSDLSEQIRQASLTADTVDNSIIPKHFSNQKQGNKLRNCNCYNK